MGKIEKVGRAADEITHRVQALVNAMYLAEGGKCGYPYVLECKQLLKNALVEYAAAIEE